MINRSLGIYFLYLCHQITAAYTPHGYPITRTTYTTYILSSRPYRLPNPEIATRTQAFPDSNSVPLFLRHRLQVAR